MPQWLSNEDYKFICNNVPIACVDLAIHTESGLLLSRRAIEPNYGDWHMPGGRIRHRETVEEAIRRIAREEVNAEVYIYDLVGTFEILNEVQNNVSRHVISLVHSVHITKIDAFIETWHTQELAIFNRIPKNIVPAHRAFFIKHNLLRI
jgi:ADP-ribose pyrophosphatase YjhB (NUDIX family)